MKLIGSNENKIAQNKNRENVPHLEITEVVLVYCNIMMIVSKIQDSYIHLFQINQKFRNFSKKSYLFKNI